jgi:hypothetical protein
MRKVIGNASARRSLVGDNGEYLASAMGGFRSNFLTGLLIGAALAALAPFAATDLVAVLSPPASAGPAAAITRMPQRIEVQIVNRAAKADRMRAPQRATGDITPQQRQKIPAGCDTAFSPLSRGAYANFASRCMS